MTQADTAISRDDLPPRPHGATAHASSLQAPAQAPAPRTGPSAAPARPQPTDAHSGAPARVDSVLRRLPAWQVPAVLRPGNRRAAWWTWLLTRAAMLLAVGYAQQNVVGDVTYYGRNLYRLFRSGVPLRETLQEYPLPVFGVLVPQFLAGGLNPLAFALLFLASMLALDAVFLRFLLRARARLHPAQTGAQGAVGFWLWFVPLMGPLTFFRFDLVPAVLAGAAVVAAGRAPARSGLFVALGAGLKLWPVALLPSVLARREARGRALRGFLAGGAVVVAVSLLVGGWGRLVSPLQWQSERGLQIESIFAAPLMAARVFHPDGVWTVRVSPYKAWEIFGAGAHALTTVSTVATGLTAVWLIWTWWRAFRLPHVSLDTVGWLVFATVAAMTVVNKTLSPQYLIWLGGPLAVMLLRPTADHAVRRVATLLLVVAGLTQLIFPLAYHWLLDTSPWQLPVATVLLLVRNVLLVVITVMAVRRVRSLTARTTVEGDDAGDTAPVRSFAAAPVAANGQSVSSTA